MRCRHCTMATNATGKIHQSKHRWWLEKWHCGGGQGRWRGTIKEYGFGSKSPNHQFQKAPRLKIASLFHEHRVHMEKADLWWSVRRYLSHKLTQITYGVATDHRPRLQIIPIEEKPNSQMVIGSHISEYAGCHQFPLHGVTTRKESNQSSHPKFTVVVYSCLLLAYRDSLLLANSLLLTTSWLHF